MFCEGRAYRIYSQQSTGEQYVGPEPEPQQNTLVWDPSPSDASSCVCVAQYRNECIVGSHV